MNRILCRIDATSGWLPIIHMIQIAATFLDAEIVPMATEGVAMRTVLPLPFRKGGRGGDLYVARNGYEAIRMMARMPLLERRAWRILWIVDSFHRPDLLKARCFDGFDVLAVMQKGEVEHYAQDFSGTVLFCGWGADVAGLFADATEERDIDVLRVGRQPDIFQNDACTAARLEVAGLSFCGRPPYNSGPRAMEMLGDYYRRARILLASSNLVDNAAYTSKYKEYLTGRWCDALAAGCVVAGRAPVGDLSCAALLWPGATAEIDVYDLDRATGQLVDLVSEWSLASALENHRMAAERLDWRLRLNTLAEAVGHSGSGMTHELDQLRLVGVRARAAETKAKG